MTAEQFTELLKRYKPSGLRVELASGDRRDVPIAKSGNRWARAVKVLGELDWEQIEFLDAKGGVLHIVRNESDDEDDEDDEDGMDDRDRRDMQLVKLLHKNMQGVMKEFRLMFAAGLQGMADVATATAESVRTLGDTYQAALRVQAANAMVVQQSGGGDDNEVMKMMQMATLMMGAQQRRVEPPRPAAPQPKEG